MIGSISVVIPAYNRAHRLPRAVESVAAQTVGVREVVIVDDASTDATPEVANRLARHQPVPIRYVRHARNRGGAAARNTGVDAATGDWIAFLDSDDAWLPRKLAVQRQRLHDAPDARAVTCADVVVRPHRPPEPRFTEPPGDDLATVLLHTYFGVASSFVVARAALDDVGGFDDALGGCQDWDLLLRVALRHRVVHVPTPLVRIHAAPDEPGITRTDPAFVDGSERFRRKHAARIEAAGERAVAMHALRMGQTYATRGRMAKARAAFADGFAYAPWRVRLALHWLATWTGADGYRTLVDLRRRFASSVAPASWRA